MIRTYITTEGDIIRKDEWTPLPVDNCFYCGRALMELADTWCIGSQDGRHDWVTVCEPFH